MSMTQEHRPSCAGPGIHAVHGATRIGYGTQPQQAAEPEC